MNLPAPPPLPPPVPQNDYFLNGAKTTKKTLMNNHEDLKCYELKSMIDKSEVLKQLEELCKFELEQLKHTMGDEIDENLGMLVIMKPLIEPMLQNGPVCGLVALVEAAQILGFKKAPDVILREAIQLGMTKYGEMFSTDSMKDLAETQIDCTGRILDTKNQDTFLELIRNCLKGYPSLIPYDADRNHSPSLRNGHAAHWAVIHGIVAILPLSKMKELTKEEINTNLNVLIIPSDEIPSNFKRQNLEKYFTPKKLLVIAHQGKSVRQQLWKYETLIQSNQNLNEISPKLTLESLQYVLPNIKDGLCSKLLLISPKVT